MSFTAIIDVFISLFFMYLVLSLLCTTVNELVISFLKLRARGLSKACTQLIDNEDLRRAFYNHGLIAGSKIASRGGSVANGGSEKAPVDSAKGTEMKERGKPRDPEHPSYFDGRSFAMALLASLDPANPDPPFGIDAIKTLVSKLPDSNIRDVLQANVAIAGDDIVKLRDDIAGWFDGAMDRLSGAFNRQMKQLSLAVGLLVAIFLNADSIAVGRAVWNDPALREQIVAEAGKQENIDRISAVAQKCIAEAKPNSDASAVTPMPDPVTAMNCQLTALKTQSETLRVFPIGWISDPTYDGRNPFGYFLLKLIGLVMTGLALSLGAPFWFDTLQMFVSIRGAGPKPQERKPAAT